MPLSGDVSGNKATARVLLVLTKFTRERPVWGVSELGRELGMTKNMVHRALSTLVKHGFVVRGSDGVGYEIGPSAIEFARFGTANMTVTSVADPFLRRIADSTGETVSLAVRNGRNAVTVAGVRGLGVIARRVPVGRVVPLHVTPAGRSILAHMDETQQADYMSVPLERFTPETITRTGPLRSHLEEVRRLGYAVTFGDHLPVSVGFALSFPVFDRDSECFASVSVSGPNPRFDPSVGQALLPTIADHVYELNRRTRLFSLSEMGSETS